MTERSLTVCTFVTVDGRYEDDDHDIASFFTHQHPDYRGADDFDHYATSSSTTTYASSGSPTRAPR